MIFWGLVPGFVSLVPGFVSWVLGIVRWVLGFVFWVLGIVSWVLGIVSWVSGIEHARVCGMTVAKVELDFRPDLQSLLRASAICSVCCFARRLACSCKKNIQKRHMVCLFFRFLGSGAWICQLGAWNCQLGAWNCQLGAWNCQLGG